MQSVRRVCPSFTYMPPLSQMLALVLALSRHCPPGHENGYESGVLKGGSTTMSTGETWVEASAWQMGMGVVWTGPVGVVCMRSEGSIMWRAGRWCYGIGTDMSSVTRA